MPYDIEALVTTALEAARAAAAVHHTRAGTLPAAGGREKGHRDFVSEVDLESQRAALGVIRLRHPGHTILAEEEDGDEGPTTSVAGAPDLPTWIVDPLDGTTNYLHGHPLYSSSVGVVVGGQAVAGAVVAAATGEEWWGGRGRGAFRRRNGGVPERLSVSARVDLRLALVGTGFPFKTPHEIPRYLEGLGRVLGGSSGVRRCGSAALDLCYLAQGSLDCFWELSLSPWDVAGGLAILSEAGGVFRRIEGDPVRVEEPGSMLAANGGELLEALAELVGSAGE